MSRRKMMFITFIVTTLIIGNLTFIFAANNALLYNLFTGNKTESEVFLHTTIFNYKKALSFDLEINQETIEHDRIISSNHTTFLFDADNANQEMSFYALQTKVNSGAEMEVEYYYDFQTGYLFENNITLLGTKKKYAPPVNYTYYSDLKDAWSINYIIDENIDIFMKEDLFLERVFDHPDYKYLANFKINFRPYIEYVYQFTDTIVDEVNETIDTFEHEYTIRVDLFKKKINYFSYTTTNDNHIEKLTVKVKDYDHIVRVVPFVNLNSYPTVN